MRDRSAAFTTAVDVRSYSPMSPETAAEVVIHSPDHRSASASARARSCASSRKLFSSATATASTPSASNSGHDVIESAEVERLDFPAGGVDASRHGLAQVARHQGRGHRVPDGSTGLPAVRGGSRGCPGNPRWRSGRPWRPCPRASCSWPPWTRCTNSAQDASTCRGEKPRSAARRSTAPMTPRLGSAGTEGTLTTQVAPSASASTRSVNVPPTSTPMRQGALGMPPRSTAGSAGMVRQSVTKHRTRNSMLRRAGAAGSARGFAKALCGQALPITPVES